jgi:hypothetical protein
MTALPASPIAIIHHPGPGPPSRRGFDVMKQIHLQIRAHRFLPLPRLFLPENGLIQHYGAPIIIVIDGLDEFTPSLRLFYLSDVQTDSGEQAVPLETHHPHPSTDNSISCGMMQYSPIDHQRCQFLELSSQYEYDRQYQIIISKDQLAKLFFVSIAQHFQLESKRLAKKRKKARTGKRKATNPIPPIYGRIK